MRETIQSRNGIIRVEACDSPNGNIVLRCGPLISEELVGSHIAGSIGDLGVQELR